MTRNHVASKMLASVPEWGSTRTNQSFEPSAGQSYETQGVNSFAAVLTGNASGVAPANSALEGPNRDATQTSPFHGPSGFAGGHSAKKSAAPAEETHGLISPNRAVLTPATGDTVTAALPQSTARLGRVATKMSGAVKYGFAGSPRAKYRQSSSRDRLPALSLKSVFMRDPRLRGSPNFWFRFARSAM